VQEELARLLEGGISEAELADAKKSMLEQRKLSRAQDGALASALLNQIAAGRTMAFSAAIDTAIAAASLDTVNETLRRYLQPERLLQVYAGDFAKSGVQSIAP
jgi:zinc protease